MSEDIHPIVTFDRINKAFITKEAVMDKTHEEAEAKSKDPVEAATRMAALGNERQPQSDRDWFSWLDQGMVPPA